MAEKGYFEELTERADRERRAAAIRQLKRAIADGKFPDNKDTVAAFAAGFYGYLEYKAAAKKATEGSYARPMAFLCFLFGLMMLAVLAIVWSEAPGGLAPQAIYAPFIAIACLVGGVLLWRRADRVEAKLHEKYLAEWG